MDTEREYIPLCPICVRELETVPNAPGGWECRCGEFIPEGLQVSPRVQPPVSSGKNSVTELAPAVSGTGALKTKSGTY